ncbi:MAG: cobalamin-dependent protein [Planctomycetota bacterium]
MTAAAESTGSFLPVIGECVRLGKTDAGTDIPRGTKGQPGVVEWVRRALHDGVKPRTILEQGLLPSMQETGRRFAAGEIFLPEVLIAARAMQAGVAELKPALAGGELPTRGVFIIGTVRGDLHDIGKNIVGIMLQGAGWRVEDLGVDCPAERFLETLGRHPGGAVGLSALLTTTMLNMREIVAAIHACRPHTVVLVGGAPVTAAFAGRIGASGYAADPVQAIELLNRLMPRNP